MGQCSTLPSEARQNATSSPGGVHYHRNQQRDDYATGTRNPSGYVVQRNQNSRAAMKEPHQNGKRNSVNNGTPSRSRQHVQFSSNSQGVSVSANHNGGKRYAPMNSPQGRHTPYAPQVQDPVPMEEDRAQPAFTPPDSSKRTRCYKLNLDSQLVGLKGGGDGRVAEGYPLGPFDETPGLTSTMSEDSSVVADPTAVAVRTAQIFRGITVSSDGTILSQNARATRANRNKSKRGEKSRQAAKIDKAKDLVEESIQTGKAPNSDDPANMVSLFIFGEYDNMSHLVRDGSKKLREASELPDEDLLSVNLQRPVQSRSRVPPKTPLYGKLISPTRKRVSPHSASNPAKSRYPSSNYPQTAPPKLKGHPRDRPSARRLNSESGFRHKFPQDACNGMFSPHHSGGNDSDWSEALGFSKGLNSIFYCGGGADQTVVPTPKTKMVQSPRRSSQQQTPDYRNEASYARAYNSARTAEPQRMDNTTARRATGGATVHA